MYNLTENRRFPRMAIDCGISYKHVDDLDFKNAIAKNISSNGMLFIADEQPAVGSLMEIKVPPGTLSIPPLSAVIEVVRVCHDADGRWNAGNAEVSNNDFPFEIAARIKTMK